MNKDITTLKQGAVAKTGKPTTINQMLLAYKDQIAAALPKHMTPERVARLAMTEVRKNPKLGEADPISLFGAVIQCAQLGMEPGIDAYLVPFWNSKRRCQEVQMMPDYRGLIQLARNSGMIGRFEAHVVKEGDEFTYNFGTQADLVHKPGAVRGSATHFYAIAESIDKAWVQFEVMSKADVDLHRARSRSKDHGPWVTDYEAMGKKTVCRQLCKFLPRSVEVHQAVNLDEKADLGVSQQNQDWIEGELGKEADQTLGITQEAAPEAPATPEPPKRTRRTKAQMDAARAAEAGKADDHPNAPGNDSESGDNGSGDNNAGLPGLSEVLDLIDLAESQGDREGLADAQSVISKLPEAAQRIAKTRHTKAVAELDATGGME